MQFLSLLKFSRNHIISLMMLAALVVFIMPVSAADQSAQPSAQESASATQTINHLLELIDQRLSIAADVAKAKWNSNSIVDDPEREKQILASISTKATTMGVTNLALVEVFFQNQFEASKIIQTRLIMHWHTEYPADFKFKDAPNLAQDIRPKLDQLTPELITALQDVQPLLSQPALRAYLLNKANQLVRDDVNGEARRTALMIFESE